VLLGTDHGDQRPAHDIGKLIVALASAAKDLSGSSKGPTLRSG
jgi:hypothetical protein